MSEPIINSILPNTNTEIQHEVSVKNENNYILDSVECIRGSNIVLNIRPDKKALAIIYNYLLEYVKVASGDKEAVHRAAMTDKDYVIPLLKANLISGAIYNNSYVLDHNYVDSLFGYDFTSGSINISKEDKIKLDYLITKPFTNKKVTINDKEPIHIEYPLTNKPGFIKVVYWNGVRHEFRVEDITCQEIISALLED